MTKSSVRHMIGLLILPVLSIPVFAGGAIPAKARICASCHGALGINAHGPWPNIAGQKRDYLISQLNAFRDGSRVNPWMSPMAKNLSDREIRELADFFSAL